MDKEIRMTVRLPLSIVEFMDAEAKRKFTSRNAQIVRALRAWMRATAGEGLENSAPAAASNNNAALQGGASITQNNGTVQDA